MSLLILSIKHIECERSYARAMLYTKIQKFSKIDFLSYKNKIIHILY